MFGVFVVAVVVAVVVVVGVVRVGVVVVESEFDLCRCIPMNVCVSE